MINKKIDKPYFLKSAEYMKEFDEVYFNRLKVKSSRMHALKVIFKVLILISIICIVILGIIYIKNMGLR